jgi:hypothetical protein
MEAILMNLFLTTLAIGGACCILALLWLVNETDLLETIVKIFYIATIISILVTAIAFIVSIWICEW